jgi:hypothetical protein
MLCGKLNQLGSCSGVDISLASQRCHVRPPISFPVTDNPIPSSPHDLPIPMVPHHDYEYRTHAPNSRRLSQRNILLADPAPSQSVITSLPTVQELSNANGTARKTFSDCKNKVEEEDGKLSIAYGIQQRRAARRSCLRQENSRNVFHAQMSLPTKESCKFILGWKCARSYHQNERRKSSKQSRE